MPFLIRNLSVLGYANGFTLWHYKSATDNLAAIGAANYFAASAEMVAVGDMIMVAATDGARILRIVSRTGGVTTGLLS
jgi:hypothetical protein